jgi:hypothetical protein
MLWGKIHHSIRDYGKSSDGLLCSCLTGTTLAVGPSYIVKPHSWRFPGVVSVFKYEFDMGGLIA